MRASEALGQAWVQIYVAPAMPLILAVPAARSQVQKRLSTTRHGSDHVFCIVQLSPMDMAGYSLALAGACWYNYQKLQAMKAQQALETEDRSGAPVSAAPAEQKLVMKTGLSS